MFTVVVRLQPTEWEAAWRRETSRLVVSSSRAPRLKERAAIRVELTQPRVSATVLGTVVSVHRDDRGHRVELSPEGDSLPAVRMLGAAARGEPIQFCERSVRYLVKLPVVVSWKELRVYANTVSISQGGCALRWSGPLPLLGEPLSLRVGAGAYAVDLRGEVAWRASSGSSATAGVRFLGGTVGTGAAALVAEAQRAGAPQA